jgi:hypothetical protein
MTGLHGGDEMLVRLKYMSRRNGDMRRSCCVTHLLLSHEHSEFGRCVCCETRNDKWHRGENASRLLFHVRLWRFMANHGYKRSCFHTTTRLINGSQIRAAESWWKGSLRRDSISGLLKPRYVWPNATSRLTYSVLHVAVHSFHFYSTNSNENEQ